MTETRSAYYINGITAWKHRLEKELRLSMARYARLEGQCHPHLQDQGRFIDLQMRVLKILNAELQPQSEDE